MKTDTKQWFWHSSLVVVCLGGLFGLATEGCGSDDHGPAQDSEEAVLGIDNNNDGIRDDVEEYITNHFDNPAELSAARQYATALQNALAATFKNNSRKENNRIAQEDMRGYSCLQYVFDRDDDDDSDKADEVDEELRKKTFNTKARLIADRKFDTLISGAGLVLNVSPSACDFGSKIEP